MRAITSDKRKYLIAGAAVLALAAGAYALGRVYPPLGPGAGTIGPSSAYFAANRAKPVPPGWRGTAFDAQEEFSMTPAEADILVRTGQDARAESGEKLAVGVPSQTSG